MISCNLRSISSIQKILNSPLHQERVEVDRGRTCHCHRRMQNCSRGKEDGQVWNSWVWDGWVWGDQLPQLRRFWTHKRVPSHWERVEVDHGRICHCRRRMQNYSWGNEDGLVWGVYWIQDQSHQFRRFWSHRRVSRWPNYHRRAWYQSQGQLYSFNMWSFEAADHEVHGEFAIDFGSVTTCRYASGMTLSPHKWRATGWVQTQSRGRSRVWGHLPSRRRSRESMTGWGHSSSYCYWRRQREYKTSSCIIIEWMHIYHLVSKQFMSLKTLMFTD